MEWSLVSSLLISLITLTFLEIILGIDNIIFISIACDRLPPQHQRLARRVGLSLALIARLVMLASLLWLIGLTKPLFTLFGQDFSIRGLLLMGGGLFLLFKGTFEIHEELEGSVDGSAKKHYAKLGAVILQIVILDIVFSIDSIFTAVGMTQNFWIMATAIIIAIITMVFASESLANFVARRPTIKMLALSFILLIGMVLIADGFNFHIPRAYIYFALSFSVLIEILNTLVANKKKKDKALKKTKSKMI